MSNHHFNSWMKELDECLYESVGVTSQDLPDWDFFDAFEDGLEAYEAASAMLRDLDLV